MVVMPAYDAERTIEKTWRALPLEIVDYIIVVDDASNDNTAAIAKLLGLDVRIHKKIMAMVQFKRLVIKLL